MIDSKKSEIQSLQASKKQVGDDIETLENSLVETEKEYAEIKVSKEKLNDVIAEIKDHSAHV